MFLKRLLKDRGSFLDRDVYDARRVPFYESVSTRFSLVKVVTMNIS